MYSPNIDKQCRQCVFAKKAIGVVDYMHCDVYGGYYKTSYCCEKFKYDILKKNVRRKKSIPPNKFTASDFSLD